MKLNPFAWILVSFPIYLLVKGRAADYIALAKGSKT